MTKTRSTKRALLMSGLALLMCVSMLIGSTFAWFTDSVTSAGNKIQSGTLKLDLELLDKEEGWVSIKESKAPIFDYDLWEPGYTDVKVLKIENEGTLALKWYAKFISEDDLSILADVIDVYVKEGVEEYPENRTDLSDWTKVGTVRDFVNTIETTTTGNLAAGAFEYLGIALKMREEAGNDYQGLTLGAFDIMILATQDTVESDSFNNQYDKDAEYPTLNTMVSTADELIMALASGEEMPIALANDIDGFSGTANSPTTIDLNKNTLNNSNTFTVKDDFTMSNGVVSMDGTSGYVNVRPDDESVYTFSGVKFVNEYRRKPNSNTGSDRIEAIVKHTASNDAKITFVFENCEFENAQATFSGLSGVKGEVDITFKDCTFNAMMGSDPVINIGSNLTGTVNIDHCIFNISGTYANVSVIDVSNSSTTTVTVNATNNTLNANKAVPYTYDPAKGETEADSVKIGSVSSVRNYCMFDLRLLPGGYSTINETGTILQGEVAVPSLHN